MLFLVTARISGPGWGENEEVEVEKQKTREKNKKKGALFAVDKKLYREAPSISHLPYFKLHFNCLE